MNTFELIVLAVALSMDAFAVSMCKGLSVGKLKPKHMVITGIYFGGFQALMPALGFVLGAQFNTLITSFDHWIAFALLTIIGVSMIKEALGEAEKLDDSFTVKTMLPLAVATRIDALAVGVNFAFLKLTVKQLITAVVSIGITTFILSAAGVKIGNIFGTKYKAKAEIFGGVVLIILGIKILLEHLGILEKIFG